MNENTEKTASLPDQVQEVEDEPFDDGFACVWPQQKEVNAQISGGTPSAESDCCAITGDDHEL